MIQFNKKNKFKMTKIEGTFPGDTVSSMFDQTLSDFSTEQLHYFYNVTWNDTIKTNSKITAKIFCKN